MAVPWTTLELPFGGSINTKVDSKLLKPPYAADLRNIVFTDAPGYRKRYGYDQLVDLTATRITTCGNELLAFTSDKLYSYAESNTEWIDKGFLHSYKQSEEVISDHPVNQTLADVATSGNIRVCAWVESSAVHYSVQDIKTGVYYTTDTTISNSNRPKVAKTDSNLWILYWNSAATSLRATKIPVDDPDNPSDAELQADMHSDGLFDWCEDPTNGANFYIVYKRNNGGTPNVTLFRHGDVSSSGLTTVEATSGRRNVSLLAVGSNPFVPTKLAIAGFDVDVWYYDYTISTDTLSSVETDTTANVVNLACCPYQEDRMAVVWEESAAHVSNHKVRYNRGAAALIPGPGTLDMLHCSLASSIYAITEDTIIFRVCHDSGVLQRVRFTLATDGNNASGVFRIIGRDTEGIAEGNITPHLPRINKVSTGVYECASVYRNRLSIDADYADITAAEIYAEKSVRRIQYDFGAADTHRSVSAGGATYITGGILWQYDGQNAVEQGFHLYPEVITLIPDTGGLMTSSVDYNYRVYYEWYNARGERQRSTALVQTVSMGGTGTEVNLTIPTLAHTEKGADVSVVVYRSLANAVPNQGAPFYRVSDPDPSVTGVNGYLANDPTANALAFVDQLADTAIVDKELDYQNTNELDNTVAPSPNAIVYAKNRAWVVDSQGRVVYSKLRTFGSQLEFHDGLVLDVPDEGGAVTGLAALNHFLVVFKKDRIYVFSGEGPDNFGRGFFNQAQLVSTDVGCSNQLSIVQYDMGLLFQSDKGLYRLGQNLDVKYIGFPVEKYNDQSITSAILVNDDNEIRFQTSSGRTLVYNYLFDAWSTFTNHEGVSAVLWKGKYAYVRTNGRVWVENSARFDDAGSYYEYLITTAPIYITGLQGYMRVRAVSALGSYYSPHQLRVRVSYDHEPQFIDTGTWDPSLALNVTLYGEGTYDTDPTTYGGSGSAVYQAEFRLPRQKCQVIQFEFSEQRQGVTQSGRAMELDHIQIELAPKSVGNSPVAIASVTGIR